MKLLLDTHVFLWWETNDPHLPEDFGAAIASSANDVFVSAATIWEIAIKRSIGKLQFAGSAHNAVVRHGFQHLSITSAHAEWAGSMPDRHRDPFDRMLIAQADHERLVLMTVDEQVRSYPITCFGT
jgi:PIN domain nuclease of toxin-antitoxin system